MRSVAILLGLLLTALSIIPVISFSEPAILSYGWGTPQQPEVVYPGYKDQVFYLEVIPNGYQVLNATMLSQNTPIYTSIPQQKYFPYAVGYVVQEGDPTLIEFVLSVRNDAKPGNYQVAVILNYCDNGYQHETFYINIPVYAPPFPEVSSVTWGNTQYAFSESGPNEVSISLLNPSSSVVMNNVSISIKLPGRVESLSGGNEVTLNFPQILPGGEVTGSTLVNVSNVIPGKHVISFTVNYVNGQGYAYNATGNFTTCFLPGNPIKVYVKPVLTSSTTGNVLITLNSSEGILITGITGYPFPVETTNLTSGVAVNGFREVGAVISIPPGTPPGNYSETFQVSYDYAGRSVTLPVTGRVIVYLNGSPQLIPVTSAVEGRNVELLIFNPLNFDLENVSVTLSCGTPSSGYVEQLPSQGFYPLEVTLTRTGNLTINYTIKYEVNGRPFMTSGSDRIQVFPKPDVSTYYSQSVERGEEQNISVIVENHNRIPIQHVEVSVYVNLTMISPSEVFITCIPPNGIGVANFTVFVPPTLATGVTQFSVSVSYSYDGLNYSFTNSTPLVISDPQGSVAVSIKNSTIFSGGISHLLFCISGENESLVSVNLQAGEGLTLEKSDFFIGNLSGKVLLNDQAITLLNPGELTQITVLVSYLHNGRLFEVESIRPLFVISLVNFSITSFNYTLSGGVLSVSFCLINQGVNPANGVTVYLSNQSDFVGTVNPDTPIPVSFTLPSGGRSLDVRVTYQNSFGIIQTYSREFNVSYAPQFSNTTTTEIPAKSLNTSYSIYVVVAILAVAVIGSLMVVKRSKK
ncbi:hypothetical protein HS7_13230 [Sulfolobales archaeon HS-7]|nr:hypothetical protein HS7_13230 [Sulfolobales archaeon HS-7]